MSKSSLEVISRALPGWLKAGLQRRVDFTGARGRKWISEDPFRNDPPTYNSKSGNPVILGIIKEFWHLHWYYIAACREMDISYRLLDISDPDWVKVIRDSGCDAFLVRPSVLSSTWKEMYDERLRVIQQDMGRALFPSYDEVWIWESKRRMHYWLDAHQIRHPKTWIFYDYEQAIKFVSIVEMPLVFKSNMGSGSSGVIIFRDRERLKKHLKVCFYKGYSTHRRPILDNEWGFVFLQEYLPNVREWRIIRIGNSFFGFEKIKSGNFHSGSKQWGYGWPPEGLLDFVKEFTDKAGFQSMAADVFVDENNSFYVNELQTMFGQHESRELCRIDGKTGRMVFSEVSRQWSFEVGEFCRNNLCNLRVNTVVERLHEHKKNV